MTLHAPLDLKNWFEEEVQDFLCFKPTSTSPQPVHVLNGFFHSVLSGRRAPGVAASLVAPTKGGLFADSHESVRKRLEGRVEVPARDADLDRVRHAFSALIASDRAVFKQFASFQIAHLGLVSSDSTHFGLGDLAARLACRSSETQAVLERVVDRLKGEQPNPHWHLQSVLVDADLVEAWNVEPPSPTTWWADDPRCKDLGDVFEALVRRSLTLAAESRDTLLPLQVLASTLTWVGLMTYAQVPSSFAGKKVPLLVEATAPGRIEPVRDASSTCLRNAHGAFNDWLATRLEETLPEGYLADELTDEAARRLVRDSWTHPGLSGGKNQVALRKHLPEVYDAWRHGDEYTPRQAVARALTDAILGATGDKPRKWFEAVGRSCGFVGPRRGQLPRARAEVSMAPTLLLAGLDENDGDIVPLTRVLERLWDRFGIVIGPSEGEIDVSETLLEANLTDFKRVLTSLDLAHLYSDGVTEIINPLHRWSVDD